LQALLHHFDIVRTQIVALTTRKDLFSGARDTKARDTQKPVSGQPVLQLEKKSFDWPLFKNGM
jgi:hypothetical protein